MSNDVTEFQIGMVAEMDMETGTMTLVVPDKYETEIINYCRSLQNLLLEKYRKGKAEHGELDAGKPLNCQKEILNEVLDILNYHLIDRVQKNSVAK